MTKIYEWKDISSKFKDGLLLGNGASIAVHSGFNYPSLFEEAGDRNHITPPVADVFSKFKTNDFELVLRRLWHAVVVNKALGISPGKVEGAYAEVRHALIRTVRDVHVTHAVALPHLEPISLFMRSFKTVVSLNYDLITYWAMMHGNESIGATWFKDGFLSGTFTEDWKTLREPIRGATGATLCFYPHGNISLRRSEFDVESKIAAGTGDLLDAIISKWDSGESVPIFVCEGTSDQKIQSINGSSYLQRVYREVMRSIGESLVVYGWGIGEQETHILQKLHKKKPLKVAVSVFGGDKSFISHAEKRLEAIGIEKIYFFDSKSPGCWNNPA